jgi:DNA polymerase V
MKAVDQINRKFGRDTIRFAGMRRDNVWRGRAERRSPLYTTRLNDVLCVK